MYQSNLRDLLVEIRADALGLRGELPEVRLRALTEKYGALFTGDDLNVISSLDLLRLLNSRIGTAMPRSEFNAMLPAVCESLGMDFVPLVRWKDVCLSDPPVYAIMVTVY